jgi:Asp-tRNA(Asn)/Glu-tRNA(Gln) amidotransferase C subunit
MRELNSQEVRALADASGLTVPEADLERLTIRLNGLLTLLEKLDTLPAEGAEIIPTLLDQGGEL